MTRTFLVGIVFFATIVAGCERTTPAESPRALAMLALSPSASAGHVCDSSATDSSGVRITKCFADRDTTYSVRNDTVVAMVTIEAAPMSSRAMSLREYWEAHFRATWQARMGGVASKIDERRGDDYDYLEAIWDQPSGVRDMLTLHRRLSADSLLPVTVTRASVDCRDRAAMATPGCN